jgi:3-oxoacyl-[acyl-carrier protein] reductase
MKEKKVIIITGARKGIGRELAVHFAKEGEYTVIGCSRQESDLLIDNYEHFCVDISDEKSVKQFFSEIRKKYKRLDILINNAGVNYALAPTALVSYSSAEATMKVNFLGTFLMSREAVKIMMKNSFGRIINFGSMAVRHEEKGEAIYTASKAAINTFTKILAKEVYQYGITCNIVSPSAIKTDLLDNINIEALKVVLQRNAIPQLGSVDEVINVIQWLLLPQSESITGQNIYMGGV